MAFDNTENGNNKVERNNHQKYFLSRKNIKYNVLIDGRNFYDQSTSDEIKKYDELRKNLRLCNKRWRLYNRVFDWL